MVEMVSQIMAGLLVLWMGQCVCAVGERKR